MPDSSTPDVELPLGKDGYGKFGSNYERWAAQEVRKRLNADFPEVRGEKGKEDGEGGAGCGFSRLGFLLQGLGAGWHCKSREQCGEIGDKVGRERILVMVSSSFLLLSLSLPLPFPNPSPSSSHPLTTNPSQYQIENQNR